MTSTDPPSDPMSNLSLTTTPTTTPAPTASKGTAKRDALRTSEISIQAMWESDKVFESNAEESSEDDGREKFLVTFPYPYTNGHLHLGHAFSLTKSVFRAQFERHRGKNVLFPFGFHCTGMPIQAAANKLKSEIAQYGNPPIFPKTPQPTTTTTQSTDKSKGAKTKLVAKTGNKHQWEILAMMVPPSEIPLFTDPLHWLHYFPPIGVAHLRNFGPGIDWRRSFITTQVNPFYDAFIRWQFNTLREKGVVKFGVRNCVFSILDGQVCADHDRSAGEGVGPQEYTLIKLRVLDPEFGQERHGKMTKLLATPEAKKGVYFVPATLRPETMYGQTNCFVLPTGEYGAFWVDATEEVWVMSHRSARGLSCQAFDAATNTYYTKEFGRINCLATFSGDELLGLPLQAPNATYEKVYTLPLLTISMDKGTGVVTSVPSDAPDDYVALKTLQDKPDYAAKYGILPEMVDPFQVVPIISIEGYGDASAVFMCEKLKIKSSKDAAKLQKAKDETYLKGFTMGVMQVGPYKGKKVCDIKAVVKNEMIAAGQACLYFEPESKVVSRTNDECVVASTDQWYLSYGEESWSGAVKKHVLDSECFNAYDASALGRYDYTIGWLKEWACTRQFGLGTNLPWDTQWVIESLSDSTIYMAYYTIAHILQGEGNLEGKKELSPFKIDAADLTDDVFNYIYRKGFQIPADSKVPTEVLEKCRTEFRYWYPMDLRVSAKDLITNHLTMALYNHAAVWDDEPELWPRGYYTNGHILVNGEKMAKSKGNFLMMEETIQKYSADAVRFACADAGDSLDDANFNTETADNCVLSLCNEENWITETLKAANGLRTTGDLTLMDRVLHNEVDRSITSTESSFAAMQFREGLLSGWHDMLHARNEYRSFCQDNSTPMHRDVITRWAEALVVMICPICPHWSEKMWSAMGKTASTGYVVKTPWPVSNGEDKVLTRQAKYLRDSLKTFRAQVGKAKKGWTKASILVTDSYPQWKIETLLWMQEKYVDGEGFPADFMKQLKTRCGSLPDKKLIKFTMQFASFTKKEVEDVGPVAMETSLPFDQCETVQGAITYIKGQLGLKDGVDIIKLDGSDVAKEVPSRTAENVVPGKSHLWCR